MNLSRFNHILIPSASADRDRIRRRWFIRILLPIVWFYNALSSEGRTFFLLWLIAGAAGLQVDSSQVYILWSAMTGLLVASIAARGAYGPRGLALHLEVPRRVALDEAVNLTAVVSNRGPRTQQALRVERPLLPWDGAYDGESPTIRALDVGGSARARIRARFSRRGEHHLDPVAVRALVPLGLTAGRGVRSEGASFIVLPRVAPVTSLRTPIAERFQPGGVALASRTGESMELVGVRPYQPGDPVRDLHARSWARVGFPVVRHFEQEYFTRIGVALDVDSAAASEDQIEAAISLAAGVVAHLSRGEALIDLLVVGDQVHRLTLGRSLGFLEQALDLLACVEAGPALDPETLVSAISPHLGRLSSVIFIALAWDDARRAITARIRSAGVGCRALVVSAAREELPAADLVTPVTVSAINDSDGLAL